MEMYKKRKEEREAKKHEKAESVTPDKAENKKMIQKVLLNESQKEQDKSKMLDQINKLANNQAEEK